MKEGDRVVLDDGDIGVITSINEFGVVTIETRDKIIKHMESDFNYKIIIDEHYNNENGSLYLFSQQHGLNAWEFDILKRVVRCRKKGQFKEDLEKTKRVIDLYLSEFKE